MSHRSPLNAPLPWKDKSQTPNGGQHPWRIDGGFASTVTLYNADPQNGNSVALSIHAGNGTTWNKALVVEPLSTVAIRINDIINGQQADDRGNTLPPNSVRGMVSWFTLAKPKIVGMLAQSDSITGVVRPFACVTTYAVCPSGIYLPSVTVAVGNSTGAISPSLSTCGTNGDCSCIESCVSTPGATLATYNWSSANSSILSLTTSPTASTADYQGMAAGTTSMQLSGADGLGCGASGGGPATVCSLAISSPVNGQVFDTTSGSYNQAALPLNATSSCPGTATWSFSWSYRLISTIAIYTGSTTSTIQTLNQPTTYPTPAGNGGQGATTVQALGKTLNLSVFVDGATIPNATVASTLTSLYGGATPNLLVGVAYIESSCRQFSFTSHPAYAIQGYWPLESSGGSYVGLMQVPPSQSTLFDWTANASAGNSVFQSKLSAAASYSNQQTAEHPTLPALTATQREDEALWLYAGYGIFGDYYLPNADYTGWVVTTASSNGVTYVQNVHNQRRGQL